MAGLSDTAERPRGLAVGRPALLFELGFLALFLSRPAAMAIENLWRGEDSGLVNPLWGLGFVVLFALLVAADRPGRLFSGPNLAYLVFIVWTASLLPLHAQRGEGVAMVVKNLVVLLAMAVAVGYFWRRGRIATLFRAIAWSGLIVAVEVLANIALGRYALSLTLDVKLLTTFSKNINALWITLSFACALLELRVARGPYRALLIVLIFVLMATVMLLLTRIGLLLMLAVGSFWLFERRQRFTPFILKIGAVLMLAAVAVSVTGERIAARFAMLFDPDLQSQNTLIGAAGSRYAYLVQALDLVEREPLFGWGKAVRNAWTGGVESFHNGFAQVAVESGLPGLLLFLIAYIGLLLPAAWRLVVERRQSDVLPGWFLTAILFVFFAAQLTENTYLNNAVSLILWMLMAICARALSEAPRRRR